MKRVIFSAIIAMVFVGCAQADPILTLLPASGIVGGDAGTVVGWGFTFTNNSPAWMVLTGSTFSGSQVNGTYVDYLSSNFDVAGPAPESPTISQAWDSTTISGLGEFDIFSTAPPGTDISGDIVVSYDVYSQDPNDPAFDPGSYLYSAQTPPVSADVHVPEPSWLALLLATLLLPLSYPVWRRRITRA
ncbi:MAG: hypothetical protein ACRD2S_09440 [Terriglobales bacterium]